MVKITFCDRCTIEIRRTNRPVDYGEFDNEDFESLFEDDSIQKFHLCNECLKGYNKLIVNTNKEISNFMKSANKDEGKSKDKKFTFFKKKKRKNGKKRK